MAKTKTYRDIKNFLHNDVGFTRVLIEEMADKYTQDKLEAIINGKLDEMMNGANFERMVSNLIDKKLILL